MKNRGHVNMPCKWDIYIYNFDFGDIHLLFRVDCGHIHLL